MSFFDDPMSLAMVGGGGNANSGLSHTLMQMRMMNNMQRGDPRVGRPPQQGQNPFLAHMMGGGAPEQNYSQFTFDPAAREAASKALSPYGLSPLSPDQASPYAFLPNSGFFGRHTRIGGAIEGGLFGAATSRGADTWGEGISNVAQSLIQGPAARNAMWQRQFAAPFQAAGQLEGLQDLQQKRELTEADIQWRRAEAQKALRVPDDPMPKYSGHMPADDGSVYSFPNDGGKPVQSLPPGTVSHPDKTPPNPLGSGLDSQIIRYELGDPPKNPKAAAQYGRKAEAIRNRMARQQSQQKAEGADAGHKDERISKLKENWANKQAQSRESYKSAMSKKDEGGFQLQMRQGQDPTIKDWGDVYDRDVAPGVQEPDWGSMEGGTSASPMPAPAGNPYRKK